jgi:S-formylglutathione hydrolase FrmB
VKWALRQPERFAAAASLSGAVDVAGLRTERVRPEDPRLFDRVFGESGPAGGPDDLRWLLEQADPATLPGLYVCCGTEDMLIDDNRAFVERVSAAGVRVTSDFGPGEHDWAYWDATIQDVLAWLPLRTPGG